MRTLFLFITLLLLSVNLNASEHIELETGKVSTLIFEEEIVFFNANLDPSYLAFMSDFNKLQVSALKDFEKGVINVELMGGEILSFTCRAEKENPLAVFFIDNRSQENREKSSYDNRIQKEERSVENNYIITDEAVLERVERGIAKLKKLEKSPCKDLGHHSFGVKALIQHLYADKDHLYVCLSIYNASGMVYEIDYLNFTYSNLHRSRFFGKNDTYDVEVFPTYQTETKRIEPYQLATIYVAIPIFAINERSSLKIACTERNGFRNIQIPIKGRRLIQLLKS